MAKNRSKRCQEIREERLAYWTPHIKACKENGETASHYCRKHELSLCQFKYWEYHLNGNPKKSRSKKENSNNFDFIEIKTTLSEGSPAKLACSSLTICSPNGLKILIEKPYSQTDLEKILLAMGQALC